ncbi:glucarate dehydratase, partial [Streptomyces varsoviensis]
MDTSLAIAEVHLTPILIADPPLLNTQGVHQPYTPRLIVEVVTRGGVTGVGETYGDGEYLALARPLADSVMGLPVTDVNRLFSLAEAAECAAAGERGESGEAG